MSKYVKTKPLKVKNQEVKADLPKFDCRPRRDKSIEEQLSPRSIETYNYLQEKTHSDVSADDRTIFENLEHNAVRWQELSTDPLAFKPKIQHQNARAEHFVLKLD